MATGSVDVKAQVREEINKIFAEAGLGEGDFAERARRLLEAHSAANAVRTPERGRVVVIRHNDPEAAWRAAEAQYKGDAEKEGIYKRWANARVEGRTRRQAQGYEYLLDKDGNEIRMGDSVLMGMNAKERHERYVVPNRQIREHRMGSIESQFHEEGEKHGLKTFGEIKYDKVPEEEGGEQPPQ